MTFRSFSYGGGVQSTACLVLAATGEIDYPLFLFANVGDDSENPATIAYLHEIAEPYAAAHGIELVELHKTRHGIPDTLIDAVHRGRGVLPTYLDRSGAPAHRTCTTEWKIRVIARELRRRGATADEPATVGLGISTDEIQRAKPGQDPRNPEQYRTYPLLDLGIDRLECGNIITRAGLPIPEKSSCWFCPFKRRGDWLRMRVEQPDQFDAAVQLEHTINKLWKERGEAKGEQRGYVHLSAFRRPLDELRDLPEQLPLFDGGDCDSGYCMT